MSINRTSRTLLIATIGMILVSPSLGTAPLRFKDNVPTLEDEHFKTACGPIACYVAANLLGAHVSLDDVVHDCSWSPNKTTNLEQMLNALASVKGIECTAARLTPDELSTLLKRDDTVVIIPARKDTEEIDHAYCAVRIRSDGAVQLIDYPGLVSWKLLGEITRSWDGPALIVRASKSHRFTRNMLFLCVPTLAGCLVILTSKNALERIARQLFRRCKTYVAGHCKRMKTV